jgi:sterol desaturase/sphingolipid hydroxylase (fatty acid hydroxylase superfamily)
MWDGAQYFVDRFDRLFLSVGSLFSLTSLATALLIAVVFLVYRRRLKNRPVRALTILRGLFPRHFVSSPSFHIDLGCFYVNAFAAGLMFGWAILSYKATSNLVIDGLNTAFGPTTPSGWSILVVQSTITVLLFLAYEFGYWLDHFLKHRVPVLWEFHKVHHSANVLTPLTVYRIHPVDAIIFNNILVLCTGLTSGIASYAFGKPASPFTIDDANLILVVFFHAVVHLQHTHLWISFRGPLGRLLMSPAHHQIHHSNNPIHFDKNLGNCLAVWDWMFGTLHVPSKERENLVFGIEAGQADVHTLRETWVAPIQRAAELLAAPLVKRRGEREVTAPSQPRSRG